MPQEITAEEMIAELDQSESNAVETSAAETPATPAPAEQPWSAPEFLMLGTERVDWNKAQTWMSQGRHFSQNQAKINQERAAIEAERAKLTGYQRYQQIDDFVQTAEGQKWWDSVQNAWNTRALPPEVDPNMQSVVAPLLEQLNELKSWRESTLKDQEAAKAQQEDKALIDQVQATREKFANIDFDAIDESGKTLEIRVLEHADQTGIASFRAAFLDYYHEPLLSISKADSQVSAAKTKEAEARQGIKGRSPTPRAANGQFDFDSRGMSDTELMERIHAQLGH
jgi:hypothetical protein